MSTKRNIKRTAVATAENFDGNKIEKYVIVKIFNGEPLTYNVLGNSWSPMSDSSATLFEKKDAALDVVASLCDKDRANPVFLCACSAQ